MMQLYGALILCVTLSAACGLRCYLCNRSDPKSCTDIQVCPDFIHHCGTIREGGGVTKGCVDSKECDKSVCCCRGDLCNSAIPTGPSAILLLVSSAILKFLF